jgi:hypothetical protein
MHGERVIFLEREHRGMCLGGVMVTGGHERYEFNFASKCFHQFQTGILLINWVGFH